MNLPFAAFKKEEFTNSMILLLICKTIIHPHAFRGTFLLQLKIKYQQQVHLFYSCFLFPTRSFAFAEKLGEIPAVSSAEQSHCRVTMCADLKRQNKIVMKNKRMILKYKFNVLNLRSLQSKKSNIVRSRCTMFGTPKHPPPPCN